MEKAAPANISTLLSEIEADPFQVQPWRNLLIHCQVKRDFMSMQSIAVLTEGIDKLTRLPVAPEMSHLHHSLFTRLARACNNPELLKQAGQFYLLEVHLPEIARAHLERATRLGGKNAAVDSLLAQCRTAIKEAAEKSPADPDGVELAKTQNTSIAALIRKTGQLALRSARPEPISKVSKPATHTVARTLEMLRGKTADELLEQAEQWLAANDLEGAKFACEKAAAARPPSTPETAGPLWTQLAIKYFASGRLEDALAAFTAAHDLTPERLVSSFNLGTALQCMGRHDEALQHYLEAEKIEPGHPKVWCNLGTLYFEKDMLPEAEEAFRHCVELQPAYARAWDNLGATLGAANQLEAALEACRQAIKHRSDYKEPWFKIGMITYGLDYLEQAEAAFDQALDIPACSSYTHHFLAMIYARTNRVQEAIAACMRGNDKPGYNVEMAAMAWSEIGKAFLALHDYAPAEQAFQKAVDLTDNAEHLCRLADAHAERGHYPQALAAYERAAALQPDTDEVWIRIAQIATKLRRYSVATAAWERQVELYPNDARAWAELGHCLERQGDVSAAV